MAEGQPSNPTLATMNANTSTTNNESNTTTSGSSSQSQLQQQQQQQQTPPDSNKTALIIARSFIKAYYQTLTQAPAQIYKFYKSESQLSFAHGEEDSTDMTPSTIIPFRIIQDDPDNGLFLNKFKNAAINFENGTIDVQMSSNEGILLIVTGYMTLTDEECVLSEERRFVHTFFLSHETRLGKNKEPKKNYYVLNDVFRFLTKAKVEEENHLSNDVADETQNIVNDVVEDLVTGEIESKETATIEKDTSVEQDPVQKEIIEDIVKEDIVNEDIVNKDIVNEDIDSGVQEQTPTYQDDVVELQETHQTDEIGGNMLLNAPLDMPSDISSTAAAVASAAMMEDSNSKGDHELLQPNLASSSTDAALFPIATSKPKPPGSWASLVAGGATKTTPTPQPAVMTEEKKPKKDVPDNASITSTSNSNTAAANTTVTTDTNKDSQQDTFTRTPNAHSSSRSHRNTNSSSGRGGARYNNSNSFSDSNSNKPFEPSSLYIKNIGDELKESDLRTLFGAYGHKIVNINLYPSRGFAFVDFAEPAAVTDIMKEPRSFVVNGRPLEVEKKSGERRSGGGSMSNSGPHHHHHHHHRGGNNGMSSSMGRGGGRSYMHGTRRSSPRGDNRDIRHSSDVARRRSSSGGERRRRGRGGGQRGTN